MHACLRREVRKNLTEGDKGRAYCLENCSSFTEEQFFSGEFGKRR